MRKPTALIICAHPDDGDMFCGEFCAQAINAGWSVHELLMTTDEYGTTRNDFKGIRIQTIRKNEMIAAANKYGIDESNIPKLQLHWANYVDGFTPCNKKSILRMQKFFRNIKPDIIIGPEPFAGYDVHVDHLATGKNYYFSLKWMKLEERPKIMLFYHSLMPDFFLPNLNQKILYDARKAHKSQWTERDIKIYGSIQKFLYVYQWLKNTGGRGSEGYRKVTFDSRNHHLRGFAKIMAYLVQHKGYKDGHFIPTPEQLNLDLIPKGDIE